MTKAPRKVELIPFAKVADVNAGDILIADDGFDCLKIFDEVTVQVDRGRLFVPCADGKHFLDGQIGGPHGGFKTHDHYVGLWKK